MLRVDPFEFFASLTLDLVVVALLAFVLFYRRHRDRDMAIAIAATTSRSGRSPVH
jgi:hypothetical protein